MVWVHETSPRVTVGHWRNDYGPASALSPSTSYDPDDEAEEVRIESRLRERYYEMLGRHKGTAGTREVQAAVRRFWTNEGAPGVVWLLGRIRDEHSVDVLAEVAEIAGDVGRADQAALEACLDALDRNPSEEQEDVALTALRWMAKPSSAPLCNRLRAALGRCLRRADGEIREKAVLAARALPDRAAEELFGAVYDDVDEADPGSHRPGEGPQGPAVLTMAWALRIGSVGRWRGQDAAKAAKDLELRPGEEGLSVFWVEVQEDADRIGVLFGMYRRNKPREVDYIPDPRALCRPLSPRRPAGPDAAARAGRAARTRSRGCARSKEPRSPSRAPSWPTTRHT